MQNRLFPLSESETNCLDSLGVYQEVRTHRQAVTASTGIQSSPWQTLSQQREGGRAPSSCPPSHACSIPGIRNTCRAGHKRHGVCRKPQLFLGSSQGPGGIPPTPPPDNCQMHWIAEYQSYWLPPSAGCRVFQYSRHLITVEVDLSPTGLSRISFRSPLNSWI